MTPEVILDPTTPPAVYKYTIEVAVFDFYSDAERLFLSCNDNGVLKLWSQDLGDLNSV
jgi:Tol biopolymer transport system component